MESGNDNLGVTWSIVERVARALQAKAVQRNKDAGLPQPDVGVEIGACLEFARAAIAAMREPTEAMTEQFADAYYADVEAAAKWRKMIDAALKE